MRLLDNLRTAEQRTVSAMRRGVVKAREDWGDLERRIRQRMRIYPQKLRKKNVIVARQPAELQADVPAQEVVAEPETRKPIVSIHGSDVTDEDVDHPAA